MKTFEIPGLLGMGGRVSLTAPLAGWLTALADVPDPVYSGQSLGNGVAIDPVDQTLAAPCDGIVTLARPAHHGLTMTLANGAELLFLIGVDTYNLGGDGFVPHVTAGQRVRTGDPLISFDMDVLAHKAKSLLISVIVLGEAFQMSPIVTGRPVAFGEPLATIRPHRADPRSAAWKMADDRQSMVLGRS
ncbi:MAG TPA: PTS glucose transporter subunit IIA [Telmatospirillum sp.]|nr:PTS glucose transporter subunit IIA [Telmatospirillum sp.]